MIFNRLYEYVTRKWVSPTCPRFSAEANRLQYNNRGKVEAAPGQHDDMVVATGLALMGLDQVDDVEEEVKRSSAQETFAKFLSGKMLPGNFGNLPTKMASLKIAGIIFSELLEVSYNHRVLARYAS